MGKQTYWCVYSSRGCPFEDTVRTLRRNAIAAYVEPLAWGGRSWAFYRKRDGCTVDKIRLVKVKT